MRAHKGLPTMFNGIQFRSRLEARWAAMFHLLGLNWEYEPMVEVGYYIPDFALTFPDGLKIYIEVKPKQFFNSDDPKYNEMLYHCQVKGHGFWALFEELIPVPLIVQFYNVGQVIQHGYYHIPIILGFITPHDQDLIKIYFKFITSEILQSRAVHSPTMMDIWKNAANLTQWRGSQSLVSPLGNL